MNLMNSITENGGASEKKIILYILQDVRNDRYYFHAGVLPSEGSKIIFSEEAERGDAESIKRAIGDLRRQARSAGIAFVGNLGSTS